MKFNSEEGGGEGEEEYVETEDVGKDCQADCHSDNS
jgi:hypothetical protein